MPKKNVHTHEADALSRQPADPAGALIAAATKQVFEADPSPQARAALLRVLQHNDAQSTRKAKVSRSAAVAMLRDAYGWAFGENALEALCRRLGRKSWGTP